MTVGRTIAESLIVTGWGSRAKIAERVSELLQHVGLRPEQATQYPHEFSGGQRQRIALAGALASRPQLIVLDEPVSALDVSIRAQMMNLLKDIQAQDNVAYLLVAHDLATVRYMADHTVVMYLGKIVEYAPTRSLFDNVRHPYTKALLSAVLPPRADRARGRDRADRRDSLAAQSAAAAAGSTRAVLSPCRVVRGRSRSCVKPRRAIWSPAIWRIDMTEPHGPLQGVKVVACSTAQAGTVPYMLMADLGAEVIKIEVPEGGDNSRGSTVLPGMPSTYFETNNRGVKSVTLNLKTQEGREILHKLVARAEIFGQNFRPGAAEKNGFGYEELRTRQSAAGVYVDLRLRAEGTARGSAGHGFDGAGTGRNCRGVFARRDSRCAPALCPLRMKPVRSSRSAARSPR